MDKKELVKLYINANDTLAISEGNLNSAFQDIDEENQVFNLVPSYYKNMVDTLLLEIITSHQLDWVGWWMYESVRGVSDATGAMDLENFDEFYSFVFDNVPVNELMEARSGNQV